MVALAKQDNQIVQKSNEWYTKPMYIEAARAVMGTIDLDPASSVEANKTVKADRFYTQQENGLLMPWYGNVWLNPPYCRTSDMRARHQSFIAAFSKKLLDEYAAGQVKQAILLASTQLDARWFQPLWEHTICFSNHKVHFNLPFQRASYSFHMFGTCFVYLGEDIEQFIDIFSQFGTIAKRVNTPKQAVAPIQLWEVHR